MCVYLSAPLSVCVSAPLSVCVSAPLSVYFCLLMNGFHVHWWLQVQNNVCVIIHCTSDDVIVYIMSC